MTLLEQWRNVAYDQNKSQQAQQMFWANYFNLEKAVYEELLKNPSEPVKGTVKELAEKYGENITLKTLFEIVEKGLGGKLRISVDF